MSSVDKNKQRRVFSKFYDKNVRSLYRFVFLKVNSDEVTKDIVSESFTRLWNQMMSPTEVSDLRAYIYQVARNLVFDHYRRNDPDRLSVEDIVIEDDTDLERDELISSDTESLKVALSRLRGNYQDLLIFYYVENRSIPEIAEMENKSENTIRVTIHRAMKALEDELGRL